MAGRPSAVRRPSIARISSARSGRPARSSRRPAQRALVDVPEARLGRQVVAVRVDVLAEQRDLAIAGRGERACFVDDVVERPAPLRATAERHDAVGARLVAAVDDRQPGGDRGAARDGPLPDRQGARAGQMVGRPDHGPADGRRRPRRTTRPDRRLRRGEPEPIDELGLLVRPQEHVNRRVPTSKTGPVGLPDRATGQHHAHGRVGGLELRQLALPPDDLLLGAFADRARVDDHEVGGLEARCLVATGGQQPARHLLRIAPVHLAAEGPHVEARQGPRLGHVLHQPLVVGHGRGARGGHAGGGELEHRQDAGQGRSIGHGCAGEPTTPAPGMPAASSGGTHRPAWASAYVLVSPW